MIAYVEDAMDFAYYLDKCTYVGLLCSEAVFASFFM
jgi:hypothetical protein